MPGTVSIDREAVSRPAVRAAQALVEAIDLSGSRLAGGTALAWALGHRRSDDLDFFTRVPGGLGVDARANLGRALQRIPATAVDVQNEKDGPCQRRGLQGVVLAGTRYDAAPGSPAMNRVGFKAGEPHHAWVELSPSARVERPTVVRVHVSSHA